MAGAFGDNSGVGGPEQEIDASLRGPRPRDVEANGATDPLDLAFHNTGISRERVLEVLRGGAGAGKSRLFIDLLEALRGARDDDDHGDEVPEPLILAAHYYYEHRKFRGAVCPNCHNELRIIDRIGESCPHCGNVWEFADLARLTQEDVARLLQKPGYNPSRSEVQRLLSQAEDLGVVQIVVTRPVRSRLLQGFEEKLLQRFPSLKLARVVQGRERLYSSKAMSEGNKRSLRNSVLLPAAKTAGEEILKILEQAIEEHKEPTLCLSWGYSVNLIVQELRPERSMPSVTVAPFVGALTKQPFETIYDSNYLVQRAAQVLHSEMALWLLSPALVRTPQERVVMENAQLVKETLEKARSADVVALAIADADEEDSNLRRSGLLSKEEIAAMVAKGAVGEIGGHYFDRLGVPVDDIHPIGVNLDDLKRIVKDGRIVLALVAGDGKRVEPLLAAIGAGLINALVTDHVTAQALLDFEDRPQPGPRRSVWKTLKSLRAERRGAPGSHSN